MDLNIANKLLELSKNLAPVANAKIISAVVYKGKIYGLGSNSYKTHPLAKEFHNTENKECLHAEMDALIKASYHLSEKQLSISDLYVMRTKKDGSIGLAKPCDGCESFIRKFGIKNVYYSKNKPNDSTQQSYSEYAWYSEDIGLMTFEFN